MCQLRVIGYTHLRPDLPWSVQVLVAVQTNKLAPGTAVVSKYASPVEHAGGSAEPVFTGLVYGAAEKSTPRD